MKTSRTNGGKALLLRAVTMGALVCAGAHVHATNIVTDSVTSNLNGGLKFLTNATIGGVKQKMFLNTSGQFGVGTAGPTSRLHVVDSTTTAYVACVQNLMAAGYGLSVKTLSEGTNHLFEALSGNPLSPTSKFLIQGDGRTGIGTTSPRTRLEIAYGGFLASGTLGTDSLLAVSGGGPRMMWWPRKAAFRAGYVGGTEWDSTNIGQYTSALGSGTTASGIATVAVGCSTTAQASYSTVVGRWNITAGTKTGWTATDPLFVVGNGTSSGSRNNAVVVLKNGSVGINTGTKALGAYMLKVNGKACVREMVVTDTGWSDYVLKPGYILKSLDDVDKYIKTNGHLEGVPDQAEVNRDGVQVGKMQATLLAKVEQLTLYMIEQDKRMRALSSENAALKSRLDKAGIGAE